LIITPFRNLNKNNIGDSGATALAEAFKLNSTITEVDLRSNNIGATGATALAEAFKINSTITTVDLWENNIGPDGAAAIGRAMVFSKFKLDILFLFLL